MREIPLIGEMGEAQKVIPFLREMSRSDKRFADVLRLPFSPEKGGTPPKRRDGGGRRFRFYQPILNTVGADPCVRPLNTANISITFVGAFLAQRQPFCRFATFPLTGESHCTPAETMCVITKQSDFIAINGRYIHHSKIILKYICCVPVLRADTRVRPYFKFENPKILQIFLKKL